MKAEQLRIALRPRPMLEAADLGVRMAQRGAPSLARAYLPFGLALVIACGSLIELSAWLPSLLLWWLTPWLDRILLDLYARQAFGEPTGLRQALAARARAPWGPVIRLLTWARGSPWRAFAMPVAQLEGQVGNARHHRALILLHGRRGPAMAMQAAFASVAGVLMLGAISLLAWMTPGVADFGALGLAIQDSRAAHLMLFSAQAAALLFVEPFYVAAGFAMYLNRRVELEAWDVEQELRHAFAAT